jgi:hypothetical protein
VSVASAGSTERLLVWCRITKLGRRASKLGDGVQRDGIVVRTGAGAHAATSRQAATTARK